MAMRNDLSAQTKSDLINYNGAADGTAYIVLGNTAMGDSGVRHYFYDANSTATVDGEDVLDATGMGVGRFAKIKVDYNMLLNLPSIPSAPTINSNITRAVGGSGFTISTTKQANVSYSIKITCTASIGSSSAGTVSLQYSTNGGSTWIEVSQVSNSNTVTLALTLNAVTIQTAVLSGNIPANALVKMVTTTSGTTSIAYINGQEMY